MKNVKIIYIISFQLLLTVCHVQAQFVHFLHDTIGSNYSIAQWQYVEDTVHKSTIFNNQNIGHLGVVSSVLNWKSGQLVIVSDSGLLHVNVHTGIVEKKIWPFPSLKSIGLVMKYDSKENSIYFLYKDRNLNSAVGIYDEKTNSLKKLKTVKRLNGTGIYDFYFRSETSAFDSKNNEFILQGDSGICIVSAATGIVSSKKYPTKFKLGFNNLSFHYDESDDVFYAIFQEIQSTASVAEYNFNSNTFNKIYPLDTAQFGSGSFVAHSDAYVDQNNDILVYNFEGISIVNVNTGSVKSRATPTNGKDPFEIGMYYDPSITSSVVEITQPNIKLFPNPANSIIQIWGIKNSEVEVSILDINGRTMEEFKVESENALIDISSLENGIYFLLLSVNDMLVTRKLYIHKD